MPLDTFPKCPTCGKPAIHLALVREPTTTAIGEAFPEPKIVERGVCELGHKWFEQDTKPDA